MGSRDRKLYDDFKREAQPSYLEHLPLIEQNREALKKRIESGKTGERDYAREAHTFGEQYRQIEAV